MCRCLCALIVLIPQLLLAPDILAADALSLCKPANPLYKSTLSEYGYRLKPQIAIHGCDVVGVYAAFGNGHGIILELAEDNPALMTKLKGLMASTPGVAQHLHGQKELVQALELRLQEEAELEDFWETLETLEALGPEQLQAIDAGHPVAAALALLLPHASPNYLIRNFTDTQLQLLFQLMSMTAVTTAGAELEGFGQLLPYLTTNPTDALTVYKKVLTAWGEGPLSRFLSATPQAAAALLPPLAQDDLRELNPLNSQPTTFHRMQDVYIRMVRELYETVAARYGAAWAAEYCNAIADILPLALLDQDPAAAPDLRMLLLDLASGDLFTRLFLPTACEQESNLALFGSLLSAATTGSQDFGTRKHPLSAMAAWHAQGSLFPIIYQWLESTNPAQFASNATAWLEGETKRERIADGVFWQSLAQLAMIRAELPRNQQPLFDHILSSLMQPGIPAFVPLQFLVSIHKPLFQVLAAGRFQQPHAVAHRLLLSGYPESTDHSLYESYLRGERAGYMPDAAMAIEHRGRLPEAELLIHGQTFADRHGGWSLGDVVDLTIDGGSIIISIAATLASGGAAAPAVVVAVGRICGKQAARRAAAGVARAIAKGASRATRIIPKAIRPTVVRGVKKILTEAPPPKTTAGKMAQRADKTLTTLERAWRLYSFLLPVGMAAAQDQVIPDSICPGRKEN